jgi:single-stranded-DNA-specific exonuclease
MTELQALVREILIDRGIRDPLDQERFLHPEYIRDQHDPQTLVAPIVIARIVKALATQERICIYADYDADGIPGAVILHDFFTHMGHTNFFVYIPHRHHEGYGLHRDALDTIIKDGATLLITVDLGITACNEVEYAREQGLEVIITDHHEPLSTLPDAYGIVNPKCTDYPEPMLCGAGVAFKLVQALMQTPSVAEKIPVGQEKWLLDMAGLATLSDMVPLTGENRTFAYFGMKVIEKTKRPGLRALMRHARLDPRTATEQDITFSVTPRLNAASRMAHPELAFELLATRDRGRAEALARTLIALNDERKKHVALAVRHAHRLLKKREPRPVVVIGHPDWHTGVLGLIASKIAEHALCPTFVWTREGDVIKGSCRGNGHVSVVHLMEALPENFFITFGGHHEAGGFSISLESVHELETLLCEAYTRSHQDQGTHTPSFVPVYTVSPHHMNHELYHELRKLAPFGVGNPEPVLCLKQCLVLAKRVFGSGKEHTEWTVRSGETTIGIIDFFTPSARYDHVIAGEIYDVHGTLERSSFGGKTTLRLRLKDFLPSL